MTLEQLYYTSCERGLSGFAGYQFNAVSPGASAETQREVLAQIAYKPPRSQMFPAQAEELERCPVNLCFRPGTPSILATVQYVGQDFSKRFGNYFAHALAADSPAHLAEALGPLLPIELWRAPVWAREQAAGTELPRLAGRLPRGVVSPAAVRDFLAGHPRADRLAALLSAAAAALEGRGHPVLLVDDDSDRVAQWIAAVSYLLPPQAGAALAFSTYCADPSASRLHVIGAVPETAGELPPDVFASFVLFDMAAGDTADTAPHPLADLAVRVGVASARALWQTAATLAAAGTSGLDAWLGPAAAAAALGRIQLTAAEVDRAVTWASGADLEPPVLAELALLLHGQPARPDRLLPALVEVARRGGDPALCDEIRFEQIDAELGRVRGTDPDGSPAVRIESSTIRRRIAVRLRELLGTANAAEALRLLRWAKRAGLEQELDLVFLYGLSRRVLVPEVVGGRKTVGAASDLLSAALRDWPAVRRGFVMQLRDLAGDQPREADRLLDGPLGRFLEETDFATELADYPPLQEAYLLSRGRRHRRLRARVLLDVLSRRHQDLPDAELLKRLWPETLLWSKDDLCAIAPNVPLDRLDDDEVAIWFLKALEQASEAVDLDWYLGISRRFLASPAGQRLKTPRAPMEAALAFDQACRTASTFDDLVRIVHQAESAAPMVAMLAGQHLPWVLARLPWEATDVAWVLARLSPDVEDAVIAGISRDPSQRSAAVVKRIAGVYIRYATMYDSGRRADVFNQLMDIVKTLKKREWDLLGTLVLTQAQPLTDDYRSFETRHRKQTRLGVRVHRGGG
ncbi:GTPase-associated protein 1-related protein [Catenulispora subtropica]|uniref:Uncharacterized protein n=1 Tax=Catenulispora subtropica TaxID=450798 RepID=A0ABN2R0J0_9ACTN